jgi:hypothetical protein
VLGISERLVAEPEGQIVIRPLGGTPTCHSPTRPGTSCTVVSRPGRSTVIRGRGS